MVQTFQDFELLILDNASDDNTLELLKRFKDERIRYVRNETNIGMFGNCNKALELAQGEYVIIFHDDDVIKTELLEAEVKILDKHPDVVLVGTNAEIIDEKGKKIGERNILIDQDIIFKKYEYIERRCKDNIGFIFPTIMLILSFLKEHKLFFRNEIESDANAEGYLWCEMNLFEKEFYLIAKSLLSYRFHQSQDFQNTDMFKRYKLLYRYMHKLIIDNQLEYILPHLKYKATHHLLSVLLSKITYKEKNKKF